MLQFALAATLAPQVLVAAKSPEAPMLLITSVALPVLVRVTVWPVLLVPIGCNANVKPSTERLALGDVVPVPVSDTTCGLLPALSTKVTVPTAPPAVVGLKVTLIVQSPPGAMGKLQVLASAKGAVAATELMVKLAVPVLFTVTVCAVLVVFST
jgi:hypothetical protein